MWRGYPVFYAWLKPQAGRLYSLGQPPPSRLYSNPPGALGQTYSRVTSSSLAFFFYCLTPETGERLLGQFTDEASALHESGVRFAFGGTPPVAERAAKIGFFEQIFDGSESPEQVLAYLNG